MEVKTYTNTRRPHRIVNITLVAPKCRFMIAEHIIQPLNPKVYILGCSKLYTAANNTSCSTFTNTARVASTDSRATSMPNRPRPLAQITTEADRLTDPSSDS